MLVTRQLFGNGVKPRAVRGKYQKKKKQDIVVMERVVYEFACTGLLMMLVHGKTFSTMECVDQFL